MNKMPIARTEADIFSHLLEQLRLAEEASYTLGHFYKAQDDFEHGQGFLAVGEMFKMSQTNVINIATKSMRTKAGLS
jgi:hypothetical protein